MISLARLVPDLLDLLSQPFQLLGLVHYYLSLPVVGDLHSVQLLQSQICEGKLLLEALSLESLLEQVLLKQLETVKQVLVLEDLLWLEGDLLLLLLLVLLQVG